MNELTLFYEGSEVERERERENALSTENVTLGRKRSSKHNEV